MKLYIVNWFGPYTDENIKSCDISLGLYLITGKQKHERSKSIQYCGIAKLAVHKRISNGHHKKELITRERQYWIGQVVSTNKLTRADLEIIEDLIIYFWQPKLNEKKKFKFPSPTVVLNRWFNTDKVLRHKIKYEGQKLNDVIYWDGKHWHLSNSLKAFEE
jgi:hypothetical protein